MASPPQYASFLDLPAELRNEIYSLAANDVCGKRTTLLWQDRIKHFPRGQVNQQVRHEALSVLFSSGLLVIDGSAAELITFRSFLKEADDASIPRIERLGFFFPCGNPDNEFFHNPLGPHTALLKIIKTAKHGTYGAEIGNANAFHPISVSSGANERMRFLQELLNCGLSRGETCRSGEPNVYKANPKGICIGRNDLKVLAMYAVRHVQTWTQEAIGKAGLLELCDMLIRVGAVQRTTIERKMERWIVVRRDSLAKLGFEEWGPWSRPVEHEK